MYFVFVLSVYALSCKDKDILDKDMLNKLIKWYESETATEEKQVDAEKIFEQVNEELHKMFMRFLYQNYMENMDETQIQKIKYQQEIYMSCFGCVCIFHMWKIRVM